MKVQVKYPEVRCAYCGKIFTKEHNRQVYCSDNCRLEGTREKNRNRAMKHYYKHRDRINKTKLGTRTIGPHKHIDDEREQTIVQNEIDRIGLTLNR